MRGYGPTLPMPGTVNASRLMWFAALCGSPLTWKRGCWAEELPAE